MDRKQLTAARREASTYPRTLKRHFPWRVVTGVHHHVYLGRAALELDDLEDWSGTNELV